MVRGIFNDQPYMYLYKEDEVAKDELELAWRSIKCSCGYGSECAMHCGNGHETGECAPREYKSPFKMPPAQCSNEKEADLYPFTHADANCPFHDSDDPTTNLRKGFPPVVEPAWNNWYGYREAFAHERREEESAYFMEKMLEQVTATNPPDAASYGIWMTTEPTNTKTKTKTWHDIDGRPHTYEKEVRRRPPDWLLASVSVVAGFFWIIFLIMLL